MRLVRGVWGLSLLGVLGDWELRVSLRWYFVKSGVWVRWVKGGKFLKVGMWNLFYGFIRVWWCFCGRNQWFMLKRVSFDGIWVKKRFWWFLISGWKVKSLSLKVNYGVWLSKVIFWWFLVKGYFFWSISRFVNFRLFFKTKISFSKDQRTFFVEVRVFVEFDSWWSRCFLKSWVNFSVKQKTFLFRGGAFYWSHQTFYWSR